MIIARVKSAVALNSMMHCDLPLPPLLTAGELALETAVQGAMRDVSVALGASVAGLTQTDGLSVIEVAGNSPSLRLLIEQMAVAHVLSQCYAGTAMAAQYAAELQQLGQQVFALTASAQGLRIRSWPG